jgi:hypothetical protein
MKYSQGAHYVTILARQPVQRVLGNSINGAIREVYRRYLDPGEANQSETLLAVL